MKKQFLLPLLIIFFSCSSEEEAPSNPVVGTWYYHGVTEVTTAGEEFETLTDECTKRSTISFTESGAFKELDYREVMNSDLGCVLNEATANHKMMWEEVAEGEYRIFSEGSTGTVYEIKFPDKNTLWMIAPLGAYESNGVSYKYMAYVHKRI
ncbi:hypothetical protein [Salinimicrobium terrae]|uniref:hypothetical protein n=1 Tax=Salinimicrobium terrae TaxID=470866 RepID=UPI0003FB9DBB|nr:hypothetical protein [Salinimicrobium terrae]